VLPKETAIREIASEGKHEASPFVYRDTLIEDCGCMTELRPVGTVVCEKHGKEDPLRVKDPV